MALKDQIASITGIAVGGTVAISGMKSIERLARLNVKPLKRKRRRKK